MRRDGPAAAKGRPVVFRRVVEGARGGKADGRRRGMASAANPEERPYGHGAAITLPRGRPRAESGLTKAGGRSRQVASETISANFRTKLSYFELNVVKISDRIRTYEVSPRKRAVETAA